MTNLELTVHGDNVVECDRALGILEAALGTIFELEPSANPQAPRFVSKSKVMDLAIGVTLLSGHNRWGYNVSETLRNLGSTIRENADAVISRTVGEQQEILFAMEFCGALPAGNNAWQRHGRAYSFGQAGIPYLIYNEVGGQELNADRSEKAPRFPNPAVPLSLLMFSREIGVPVLPVYEAAPSATDTSVESFHSALGDEAAQAFIKARVLGLDSKASIRELESKALEMGYQLALAKKRGDGFTATTWKSKFESDKASLDFYLEEKTAWSLKGGDKVDASDTAKRLLANLPGLNPVSLGSSSLRFALLSPQKRAEFANLVRSIYGEKLSSLNNWLVPSDKPLAIVLITGFKPRGDDSRPDRGLTPLARMLAGQDAEILTVVWGPAKPAMLKKAKEDPLAASESNGLLQSIFACSEQVLFDSVNAEPFAINTDSFLSKKSNQPPMLSGSLLMPPLGEHDIDALFHFITTQPPRQYIVEGMCNPPGGDWSGINLRLQNGNLGRWTSLPRVSAEKRPDHVIQVELPSGEIILSVESKQSFSSLEENVGPRLKAYLNHLMNSKPNVVRSNGSSEWSYSQDMSDRTPTAKIYSMALAVADGKGDLEAIRTRYALDFIASMEITHDVVQMHFGFEPSLEPLLDEIVDKLILTSSVQVKISKN